MTRRRRLLLITTFALAGAVLVGAAALVAGWLAAAVVGALLGLLIALARDDHNKMIDLGSRLGGLEQEQITLRQSTTDLLDGLRAVDERARAVEENVSGSIEPVREAVSLMQKRSDHHIRQLDALAALHALFEMRGLALLRDNFTALPDLLHTYVGEILDRRPSLVVECGSGLSTMWAAYALERSGGGRVVALENDEGYAARTRKLIAAHGHSDRAEVRLAPIREVMVKDRPRPWYDPDHIADLVDIDVLLVDGPIGKLAERSRYPALPLLRDRLRPGAVVLLDDTKRPEEGEIVELWSKEWPELDLELLPHERGTALWRVPAASG